MADAAPPPAPAEGGELPQNTQDLTIFVQQLLGQMQGRFQTMSDGIIGKIDEMGGRIDELEKSIGDIMQQAGIEDEGEGEGEGEEGK